MTRTMRYVAVGLAVLLLVAVGAFETARSVGRADPARAAAVQAALDDLPLTLNGWAGRAEAFDDRQVKQAGAVAHSYRVYAKPGTRDEVQVLVLAGPPSEVGAHDPDRCYAGAGFRPVGPRLRKEMTDPSSGQPASYWQARFDADTFPAVALQVCWGWAADGTLAAAEDARVEYIGRPVLYKVYVTRRAAAADDAADPTADFLVGYLPALRAATAPR